ncbi:MAG: hemolysin family protein [Flavobacteriales bacterium]
MDSTTIIIIVASLLASAFSSGMEIAFITANRLKIALDKKQGVFASNIIGHFIKHPKNFIAAMLIGNNVALVAYGIYMGDYLETAIESQFPSLIHLVGNVGLVLLQTIISTIIVLVLAEYIPKVVFSIYPNRWLNYLAIPLAIWYAALFVFAWVVTMLSEGLIRILLRKKSPVEEVVFGSVDLDHYVEQATGNIDPNKDIDHEIQIFQNALDFSELKARDCLVPRNEIVAMDVQTPINDLKQKFIETRLSKILIFKDNIDHIIGYVHSFQLFTHPTEITSIIKPVVIVAEPMPANQILSLFIRQKRSVAVVVDEFGGTAGMVTMEDIVEEIFGEIEDEHDKEETIEQRINEAAFVFSARLEIDYLNDKFDLGLPVKQDDYDTLGGLFLQHRGDIPEENESIQLENFELTALAVSENRIDTIRLKILS